MQDQFITIYEQAKENFKNKKYKISFLKLIKISNECSNDTDFLFLLSEVQNQLKDFVAREKTLKVLSSLTDSLEYKIMYMQQLVHNKSVNSALDVGLRIQNENMSNFNKSVVFDLLAQIYIQENDFEGLNEIVQSYEVEAILTEQYYFSKSLLSLSKSDEKSALSQLRSAVLKNNNFDRAWVALALLHDKMGDSDLSMANLEKALDVNPMNTSALKYYSKKSICAGDIDRAIDKVDFYLQTYSFDHEMTAQYADLMKIKRKNDIVQCESEKLSHYFGQQISL